MGNHETEELKRATFTAMAAAVYSGGDATRAYVTARMAARHALGPVYEREEVTDRLRRREVTKWRPGR
jgi:hypothetical protein